MSQTTSRKPVESSPPATEPLPVLVIGGGIGGMAFAIRMRQLGRRVDLVESDPHWRVYGAGISITGPTYRASKRLGILEPLRAKGFFIDCGARICRADGTQVAELPMFPIEPDLPTAGGIMRTDLHEVLSSRVRALEADVRLGVSPSGWVDHGDFVTVTFTDGVVRDYALVVAADGVFSKTRAALFPTAPAPRYTGQYCWRLVAERPEEIDRPHFFMAGRVTAGLMPVSARRMYMWLLESVPEKVRVEPEQHAARLRESMAPFGGILGRLRDEVGPHSVINCRPLEAVLLPQPWYRGRIILIGDAAHATTPHLASGAGIAIEDALVLSELLASGEPVPQVFERFMERRWERCRMVVENSIAIGELQQGLGTPEQLNALMAKSQHALLADI